MVSSRGAPVVVERESATVVKTRHQALENLPVMGILAAPLPWHLGVL
jgi:hypothetical protein